MHYSLGSELKVWNSLEYMDIDGLSFFALWWPSLLLCVVFQQRHSCGVILANLIGILSLHSFSCFLVV